MAECFKDEGTSYLNYFRSRLETIPNKHYLLLGNIANNMLDEFVNEKSFKPIVYKNVMLSAFKQAPFEFSTCVDIPADFNSTCNVHFLNIQRIINEVFQSESINRETGLLEPSFICEHLGIQGRLDFLSQDYKSIVELKSGSAQTFPPPIQLKTNNYVQTLLYYAVLNYNIGKDNDRKIYILYSKHNSLLYANKLQSLTNEAINKRNLIVANERDLVDNKSISPSINLINSLNKVNLITKTPPPPWAENQLIKFRKPLDNSTQLELEYFHSFYSFVTREHYISKAGDTEYDSTKGISSLWLSSIEEKFESGEILTNLSITENLTETDTPTIKLQIPNYDHDFLPNFRQGDIVILYERNKSEDNVTNKQIFKGSIEKLTPTEITIRIRYKQRNKSVLPSNSKYAIEHDFLDSPYNSMYRGLYSFLQANQDRKDLLLNQRQPSQDETNYMANVSDTVEIQQIVAKAKVAKDYFLLIGPPGTGKTSIALKSMVEEFFCEPSNNILLLSYTNRAVDEICDALDNVGGNPPFVRIGSELSCEPTHRKRLLEEVIKSCDTRDQVKVKIQEHRIFVGTVSSVSNKTELFKLKHFQVAIIDEASQILEPSLIGVLSAKNANGRNAIENGTADINSPLLISNNLCNLALYVTLSTSVSKIIIDGFAAIQERGSDFSDIDAKNIPTILITDLSEIESFKYIGNYGFEFFNFTKENLKFDLPASNSPFHSLDKKLKKYISFNLVKEICQNTELETITQKIHSIEKDDSNNDLNSLKISLIQLTNLVSRISHIPTADEISNFNQKLNGIETLFLRCRMWLGDSHKPIEESILLLKFVIEKFATSPSEKCARLKVLMNSTQYDYIICPTEDETKALSESLRTIPNAPKVISVADVNDSLLSNKPIKAILTGWAKSNNINRILSSFLFSELTVLFYQFENKYYNSLQKRNRKYNENIKSTIDNKGIRSASEGVKPKGFDDMYSSDEVVETISESTFDILEFELKLDSAQYSKYTAKGNLIDSIKAKRIDFENDVFIYSTESHKFLVINEFIEKKDAKVNLHRRKLDSLKTGDIIALINTDKDILVQLVEKNTNSKELASVKQWTELWKNLLKEYYASIGNDFKKLVDDLRKNDCNCRLPIFSTYQK